MQAQSESEGHPQKDGQPQRIDGDPYAEMHKNIILPRDFGIGWNVPQRNMVKIYARLYCNGIVCG